MDIIAVRNDTIEMPCKHYEFKSGELCCKAMIDRWSNEHVGFGYPSRTLHEEAIVSFGGFPINYCPWCGEKINIKERE